MRSGKWPERVFPPYLVISSLPTSRQPQAPNPIRNILHMGPQDYLLERGRPYTGNQKISHFEIELARQKVSAEPRGLCWN